MGYWNLLTPEGKRLVILVVAIPVELLVYCYVSNKYEEKKPKLITVISTIGKIICAYILSFAGIEKAVDIAKKILPLILPNWKDLSFNKFFFILIVTLLLVWGGMDILYEELIKRVQPLFDKLQKIKGSNNEINQEQKEAQNKYNKKMIQDIYQYFIKGIVVGNKDCAESEEAIMWYNNCNGKETIIILDKILKLAEETDGVKIRFNNKGLQRLLFMTGYSFDDEDDNNVKRIHYKANQRALQRFTELKNRGFINGEIDEFYITLQGKEYVLEKNALDLLPPKLDSNEQSNVGEPIKQ